MGRVLHAEAEIRAAGAALVEQLEPLTDAEVEILTALLAPVRDVAYGPIETAATDATVERAA